MRAVMVKSKTWAYASGEKPKPADADPALETWKENDEKAKADLFLSIDDAELKQVQNCTSAREIWEKLQSIFESKGPARKASLWKRLMNQKLNENGDVQRHVDEFFEIVGKLSELSIEVSNELQTIMLLHSLPESFDNFRCAIESRDTLPEPDSLKVKILDENTTRKQRAQNDHSAMLARKTWEKKKPHSYPKSIDNAGNLNKVENDGTKGKFKYRCHRCRQIGHKAADCPNKQQSAAAVDDIAFLTTEDFLLQTEISKRKNSWCLDNGCTSHLCHSEEKFECVDKSDGTKINLANSASTEVMGKGIVKLLGTDGSQDRTIRLENTLHVPDLRNNLISVSKITDAGHSVTFTKNQATIKDKNDEKLLVADRMGDLYFLRETQEGNICATSSNVEKSQMTIWHQRMGHVNSDDLWKMGRKEIILGLQLGNEKDLPPCKVCSEAKLTALPFPKKSHRSNELLNIVHTDVCGPFKVESKGRAKYFVTFTDDFSRWTEVRFIRQKSEVFQVFKEYKAFVEKQTEKRIKCVQSDNGGEFCSEEINNFLKKEGIIHRLTVPYTPQQNGVSERKNRTLVEGARCLLIQSKLPTSFWAEAVSTTNYTRNRCISSTLGEMTPFQLWHGERPNVNHLRIFGEEAYALNKNPNKGKFDQRGIECRFLGYDDSSKGYRLWNPSQQKVIVSRDVKFTSVNSMSTNFETTKIGNSSEQDRKLPCYPERNEPMKIKERYTDLEIQVEEETIEERNENLIERRQVERNLNQQRQEETRAPGRPRYERTGRRGRPRKLFQTVRRDNNDLDEDIDESIENEGNEEIDHIEEFLENNDNLEFEQPHNESEANPEFAELAEIP